MRILNSDRKEFQVNNLLAGQYFFYIEGVWDGNEYLAFLGQHFS